MRALIGSLVLMLFLGAMPSWGATVAGTLTMAPGMSGDLGATMVCIYADYNDWTAFRPLRFVPSVGAGQQAYYTMTNIPPGTYYIDAWKDNDGNGTWTEGDFIGVWGTFSWPTITPAPIMVVEGQTTDASFMIYAVGAPVRTEQASWGRLKANYRR